MEGKEMLEEEEEEEMNYKIEKAAFTLCGNEGDATLTWNQVEMCEVCYINLGFLDHFTM